MKEEMINRSVCAKCGGVGYWTYYSNNEKVICDCQTKIISNMKTKYVLLKDVDWFGRKIPAGTIYKQVNADYYHPTVNEAQCPSLAIDFYTIKNNNEYFLMIQR